MADLSTWLGEQGLGPDGISPPVADRFAAWAGTRRTYLATARSLVPLLGYLRSEGVLPEPAPGPGDARAGLLAEYRQYLRAERGLAGTTIRDYAMYAAEFAAGLGDPLDARLAALSGAQVLDIVSAQARTRVPRNARMARCHRSGGRNPVREHPESPPAHPPWRRHLRHQGSAPFPAMAGLVLTGTPRRIPRKHAADRPAART